MTRRRPSPRAVVWGSIVLFAVMLALLTSQFSAGQPAAQRPVLVRTVIKRRVVTTYVPTPGRSTISTSGNAAPAPVEFAPVTTGAS
jgi:hypothetical protein